MKTHTYYEDIPKADRRALHVEAWRSDPYKWLLAAGLGFCGSLILKLTEAPDGAGYDSLRQFAIEAFYMVGMWLLYYFAVVRPRVIRRIERIVNSRLAKPRIENEPNEAT